MKIVSIKLNDFRNYHELDLPLHEGINLFTGDNAQGKTNVLEAVYLCGTTRSHRAGKDREMIRFGEEEAHLRMEMIRDDSLFRIDIHLKKNKPKGIAINGVPIRKASELIGLGHFVFFSPEDLTIIKNGPGERRRFMDMELCQLEKMYIHHLSSYNRVLMQRSKLLKSAAFRPDQKETLDVWDDQLVLYGSKVMEERERFVKKLYETAVAIHHDLTGGKEKLEISYERNVSREQFKEELLRTRERDLSLGMTGKGPHRDDLKIVSNGIDLRRYGSQGQQRTAALSLKLAEIELVRNASGDMPVLLLDDVLSELDQNRQQYLLEGIGHMQTLITCTGTEFFKEHSFQIDRLFQVTDGTIQTDSFGGTDERQI